MIRQLDDGWLSLAGKRVDEAPRAGLNSLSLNGSSGHDSS